jgi:hypothetical protein
MEAQQEASAAASRAAVAAAAGARREAPAASFAPDEALLVQVFERLPALEQCVTVSRVSRAWRAWARARGAKPRASAAFYAARPQRPQLPRWLVAEAWPRLNGVQRARMADRAAWHGDIPRLEWLRAQVRGWASGGCGLPAPCSKPAKRARARAKQTLHAARALFPAPARALGPSQEPPVILDDHVALAAASGGRVDVLSYLDGFLPPSVWTARVAEAAAEGRGKPGALAWLLARGAPMDARVCAMKAARYGRVAVLEALLSRHKDPESCPWATVNTAVYSLAAEFGQMDMLRWLRAHAPRVPWVRNAEPLISAAQSGRLEALQWLRAQDPPAPWDERVCELAAWGGHLEVLQWLRSQEPPCPWGPCALGAARANGWERVVEWIEEHGEGMAPAHNLL